MNRKNTKQSNSLIRGLIIAWIIGFFVTAVLMLIFAFVMTKNDISFDKLHYFWFTAGFIVNIITGFTAAKRTKIKGFWAGVISSAALSAIIVFVLMCITEFSFDYNLLLLLPIGIAGGTLGGIIAANTK